MKFYGIFWIILLLVCAPLSRGQTLEVLHSFEEPDGASPQGRLIQATDGDFYGTTRSGGTNHRGTVFKISPNGTLTTLTAFSGINGNNPYAGLVQGSNDDFYGTTEGGGETDESGIAGGTIFKVTKNGVLTTLVSFNEESFPVAELVFGNDGHLYGTTTTGPGYSLGMVFKTTINGGVNPLVFFDGSNGESPKAPLILGSDGNFYGTTHFGTNGFGTVFQMNSEGVLTMLASFRGTNGSHPNALVQGRDGHFYGSTQRGGELSCGAIFKVTTNAELTTLNSFNITNGALPHGGLIQTGDGNFYGTTQYGGENIGNGTVFKLTHTGELTTLVSFGGTNGSNPMSGLVQGNDGNLYGTTILGGASNLGTVFRIVMPISLISQVSGNELVLSWPTNALGFTLQSSADFHSPTNWIDFTNAPAVVGAQFTITNNISASAQFYRLKKP